MGKYWWRTQRRADVADLNESLLDKIIQDEKSLSKQDIKAMEKFAVEAAKQFRSLSRGVFREIWQDIEDTYSKSNKQKREFVKAIKASSEFQDFLKNWVGEDRDYVVYDFRDIRTDYKATEKEKADRIGRLAMKFFRESEIEKSQEPLRNTIPSEIREWLPDSLVVEIDDEGHIERISDRFEAQRETLHKKIANLKLLVKNYNQVVEQVKKDLKSRDEIIRLSALVTSIIMETGIRPGKAGNGFVKVEEGEEVTVNTFGAITLQSRHVEFLKDNFATIEFVGKKGGLNVATLSNADAMKVLKKYVNDAKSSGSEFIFVTKDGKRLEYSDLQRYINDRWAYISPTDFRKLKATDVVLTSLREQQQDLYNSIREFVDNEVSNVKDKVVDEVNRVVGRALENAREALSHDDVATTIRSYVDPEVILMFLSKGSAEKSLRDAVLTNDRYLKFDPQTFIDMAGAPEFSKAASIKGKSLVEIMEDLREDMEEEGVMKTSKLKKPLVRLGYTNPQLRPHLRRILDFIGSPD